MRNSRDSSQRRKRKGRMSCENIFPPRSNKDRRHLARLRNLFGPPTPPNAPFSRRYVPHQTKILGRKDSKGLLEGQRKREKSEVRNRIQIGTSKGRDAPMRERAQTRGLIEIGFENMVVIRKIILSQQ